VVPFRGTMADTLHSPLSTKELIESCTIRMLGLFRSSSDERNAHQQRVSNDTLPATMGLPDRAEGGNRDLPLFSAPKTTTTWARKYECIFCGTIRGNTHALRDHFLDQHRDKFTRAIDCRALKCDECDRTFSFAS
jgi:hypothetical protein